MEKRGEPCDAHDTPLRALLTTVRRWGCEALSDSGNYNWEITAKKQVNIAATETIPRRF